MASPALGAKFGSNLFVVVNFAVENDHVAAGCGKHRLMTFRRKVKNGKAPECEADPGCAVVEGSGIIRATMGESRAHPTQSFQGMFRSSFCLPESGNSTHGDASVTPKLTILLLGTQCTRVTRNLQNRVMPWDDRARLNSVSVSFTSMTKNFSLTSVGIGSLHRDCKARRGYFSNAMTSSMKRLNATPA